MQDTSVLWYLHKFRPKLIPAGDDARKRSPSKANPSAGELGKDKTILFWVIHHRPQHSLASLNFTFLAKFLKK